MQTEYMEAQLKKARETWIIKQNKYDNEIHVLTDQVKLLQDKVEELSLCIDQSKKECDAKLKVTESRLLKERQEHEQTHKELDSVKELLLCSQRDFNSRLADADAIHEELKLKLTVMSAEQSSTQDVQKKLQEEMHSKKSQYESEKSAAEKKFNKLCGYSDQLEQTVGILECEKHLTMMKLSLLFRSMDT